MTNKMSPTGCCTAELANELARSEFKQDVTTILDRFDDWNTLQKLHPRAFDCFVVNTTAEAYDQRAEQLEDDMQAIFDWQGDEYHPMPFITNEQYVTWKEFFPWRERSFTFRVVNSEHDWLDEYKEYLKDTDDCEDWRDDGDDYPELNEPDTAADIRAADCEWFAEFQMHHPSYHHERRRHLTESAIDRKKQIARQAYGYKPLDDDEMTWRPEDCPESAPVNRWQLSENIRWVRKSDKQTHGRRERIFRLGQTANQAIDEQLEIFSDRSAPGKVGSNRLARKLQKKIDSSKSYYYIALSWCNRGSLLFYYEPLSKRLKRRIDRLERLLSIAKARQKMAKAKKKLSGRESFDEFLKGVKDRNGIAKKYHRLRRHFNSAIINHIKNLHEEDYLLGCDEEDLDYFNNCEKLRAKDEEKKIIEPEDANDLDDNQECCDDYDFRDLDEPLDDSIYPEFCADDRAM